MNNCYFSGDVSDNWISESNYERHREAIQSLVIQTFVSLFCSIPPAVLGLSLLLKLENSQIISELMIIGFSCHSSINVISLLIFSPPYRRFLSKIFRRWYFWKYKLFCFFYLVFLFQKSTANLRTCALAKRIMIINCFVNFFSISATR